MDVFEKAFNATLKHEGAYSDHALDAGGKTKYGIIERVARQHGYAGEMKDLSLDFAKKIYRSDYWDKNNLDAVAKVCPEAAVEMFDTGVNMGVGIAARFLQQALNVLNRDQALYPDLIEDGKIGPTTIGVLAKLSDKDKANCVKILNTLQGARYIEICRAKKTQEAFIRGWLSRVEFAPKI